MLPLENIWIDDVIKELDISDEDKLSTNIIPILCTHPNINMWSLRKPVPLLKEDINNETWYKGFDGTCGYYIAGHTLSTMNLLSYRHIVESICTQKWSYARPGTVYLPVNTKGCDLSHFRGYDHQAQTCVEIPYVFLQNTNVNPDYFTFSITLDKYNDTTGNIRLSELTVFNDCVIMMAVFKADTSTLIGLRYNQYATSLLNSVPITIDTSSWEFGDYDIFFFIAHLSTNSFFSLPGMVSFGVIPAKFYKTYYVP